jgi:hypothetical protein
MRNLRSLAATALAVICLAASSVASATPPRIPQPVAEPQLAAGPQYDTAHVYVAPEDFDKFTDSLVATFGGHKSQQGVFQVTPTSR